MGWSESLDQVSFCQFLDDVNDAEFYRSVRFGREASEGHFKKSAKHKELKIRMSQVTRMGKLFWLSREFQAE